jgi:hypothetical protein
MAIGTMQIVRLIRGDSSHKYAIGISGVSSIGAGWTCKMVVTPTLESGDYVVDKPLGLNLAGTAFEGQIEPDESVFLTAGKYYMIFEIENISEHFRREVQYELQVLDNGVMNNGTYIKMCGKSVDGTISLGTVTITAGTGATVSATGQEASAELGIVTVTII